MIDLNEIHSLTEFQRNVKTYIGRLKKTGRPVVLTVNGKAELVVQDAVAYQRLLDLIDFTSGIKLKARCYPSNKSVAMSCIARHSAIAGPPRSIREE